MALFGSLFAGNVQNANNPTILTAAKFKEAVDKENVQLIDVRTADEFEAGAINGAQNVDYFQKELFEKKVNTLDKEQPVYLYCRSGNRSQKAAAILESLGFEKIYDLNGGYMSWPYKNE